MKHSHRALGALAVLITFVSAAYLTSTAIDSTVTSVTSVAEVNGAVTGVFKLSPVSLSIVATDDKRIFDNAVGVSVPYISGTPWPKWYVTNTASWNTISHHYGSGQPDGYGPGTIHWTTNLTDYPPGTYTDTIMLTSSGYAPVTLIDTVQVLPSPGAPAASPTTETSASSGVNSSAGASATTPTPSPTTVTSSGVYALTPASVSLEVPADNAPFDNAVGVSLPGFTNYPWPAWYVTNTASWNTIDYHYGKGQPNGYGPGTIHWTTNLAGYAPGTYTDTITLKGGDLKPVTLIDTVKVLPAGVPPINSPTVTPPPVTPSPTLKPSTKFKLNDTIQTTSNLNVRFAPSSTSTLVTTETSGSTGIVVGGPAFAGAQWWWQVQYADNHTGWSVESYLTAYTPPVTPPVVPPVTPPVVPPVTPPVTPPPPLGTLPAHPRVWMTPSRITQLQAQVAANTSRWQKVKASADAQLLPSAQITNYGLLPNLCLAYLGTGNAAYAQRAGLILTAATVTNGVATHTAAQNDSAYYYGSILPELTDGLDWCYNGLTAAERQGAATWLMDAADWVWPETNPSRVGAWGVNDVGDNYYWDFMTTGPAALAAAGDDTGTGAISGSDRATYHINLALSKWTNVVVPFLTSSIEGGADLEGTGYDISGKIGQFVDAFHTSNQSIPQTPYLSQSLQWHMQYTTPDYKHFVPFGDQARVSDAPMYIYNRENALQNMTAANAGDLINSQVQHWLTLIGQIPYSLTDSLIANELLNYNPSAPSVTDFSSMPLSYLSQGAGDFIYRQSWTDPNTTMMAFESGTIAQSHQSLDANGLMIWKGSFWVSASANIYSLSGIAQDTSLFNNVTVGGKGQSHSSDIPQIVGTPQVSNSLVVVRGQAASVYKTVPNYRGVSTVSDYLRTVAYLPTQDTFVIVDHVTARDSSQQKVWWWQSKNPAVINGNTFTMANPAGDQRCVGQVLLPTNAALAVVGQHPDSVRGNDALSSYAVTVTLPVGNATDVVVTTIQCSGIQPVVASSDGTNITAVIGTTHVVVPIMGTQPVTLASNGEPSLLATALQAIEGLIGKLKSL